MPDFKTTIVDGLTLSDPFMIASSHWSANENVFRQLSEVRPSAMTLKTTSQKKGGAGTAIVGSRDFRWLRNSFGNRFARYTDGPAMLELWDVQTTTSMSKAAKAILPDTVLGLSVLQNEDYESLATSLPLELYGYVELNWKYTFRDVAIVDRADRIRETVDDLNRFLSAFEKLPKLIKLSREASNFLDYPEFADVLTRIDETASALIVANSRKTPVPPSRVTGKRIEELDRGVVVGDHLFLDTYSLIRLLGSLREVEKKAVPPIVASGGIVDMGAVVDVIAAGAKAVQLCTALDMWGIYVAEWFREQLKLLTAGHDGQLSELANSIQSSEESWNNASGIARDYELQIPQLAETACSDGSAMTLLEESLKDECDGATFEPCRTSNVEDLKDQDCTCVVTYGNVSAFLISVRFCRRFKKPLVEFESAHEFVNRLKDQAFQFDFAIIPEAAYAHVQAQIAEIADANRLNVVCEVGSSIMELVGDKRIRLDDVTHVYNFGGTSAQNAINELKKLRKFDDEQFIRIRSTQLVPLLRSWKSGRAILAKPPLSRLYGLLAPDEVRNEWGHMWSQKDRLLLVCSTRLSQRDVSGGLKSAMQEFIRQEYDSIVENTTQAAIEIQQARFLRHCAVLMGGVRPKF